MRRVHLPRDDCVENKRPMSSDPRYHEELVKALQINVKICIDTQEILNITHIGSALFAIKQTIAKTAELMSRLVSESMCKGISPSTEVLDTSGGANPAPLLAKIPLTSMDFLMLGPD